MVDNSNLVSAIIPVFNGASFLAGAIENVLAQNYQPVEIIIVDDGSTEDTAENAAGYSGVVNYVYQLNAGPSAARNHGIKLAQGDMIAFLDVDDFWSENKLGMQAAYLQANPSIEIAQGLIQRVRLPEPGQSNRSDFERISGPYQYINIGSALFRKSVFDRVGLFDETLRDNEDTDWFIRAWENGVSKAVLDEVTLFYCQHRTNMSHSQAPVNYGLTKLIKKHLDRLRDDPDFRLNMNGRPHSITEYLGVPPE
jgi:GT2 family glycosyltransferase